MIFDSIFVEISKGGLTTLSRLKIILVNIGNAYVVAQLGRLKSHNAHCSLGGTNLLTAKLTSEY